MLLSPQLAQRCDAVDFEIRTGGFNMKRTSLLLWILIMSVIIVLTGCERTAPEQSVTPEAIPAPTTAPTKAPANVTPAPAQTQPAQPSAGATATRPATAPTTQPPATQPTVAAAQPTPVPAQPTPAAPTGQTQPYVVKANDTPASVATQFKTTVEVLKSLNPTMGNTLNVGDTLIVPKLAEAQPTEPPATQPTTAPPASTGPRVHIVQAGENLYRIGLRYGVSWPSIARANGIVNPTLLQAGQRLVIPAR
jgi:LysM repeat protein